MRIRPFVAADTESVVALWEEAGLTRPWNDPRRDIERKLTVQPELFLVGTGYDRPDAPLLATAMGGYDGHRGWVYYVAVAKAARGTGLGAEIVAEVERLLTEMGCPKAMLLVREGNDRVIGFYEHHGYAVESIATLGKRLIPDV
jgi:ribosomal protein S18 acetylase RimI-like enzyme